MAAAITDLERRIAAVQEGGRKRRILTSASKGLSRMLASLTHFRRRVGAFIGGFEAGLANRRLKGFQPSRAHLNTLIAAAGPDITARARWLVRNNGYAANAIESWAGNVVGAGIKPSSLIADSGLKAQVQKLWLDWTDEADAEGFTDFYGLQRRAAREVFIAGEVFFRFRPRRPEDGLDGPAAAADAAFGDAAAESERGFARRQRHPTGDRVRCDRASCRLPLSAAASRRHDRSGVGGRYRSDPSF